MAKTKRRIQPDTKLKRAKVTAVTATVGENLRSARKEMEWTQETLGRKLGDYLGKPWSRTAVSNAEVGARSFDATDLLALAEVLGKPVGWFFIPISGEPVVFPTGRASSGRPEVIDLATFEHDLGEVFRQAIRDAHDMWEKTSQYREAISTMFDASVRASSAATQARKKSRGR